MDIHQTMAEALRLCLAGDESAGLALYRRILRTKALATLPSGLHIRLLEDAGLAAADALAALVVARGGDISCARLIRPDAPLAQVAEEYEALFARRRVNSRMIDRYLQTLTALGRHDEVSAIFDAPRLIHCTTIGDAAGAAAAMLEMEAGLDQGSVQISHAMRHLYHAQLAAHPVFAPLLAAFHTEAAAYLQRWRASGHPFAALVPQDFRIAAWGGIARAEGHNTRHNHPLGWVSGVYYPAGLPVESVGGTLRIGGWQDPPPPGWPDANIRPGPGLLVLMPSWFVHWTEPTRSSGARLAIPFDARPGKAGALERESTP